MLNTPFVTDLKAIRNGWLLINAAHLPEQISLSMLSYFSLLTPYFKTFLSFWRLISFIIFILCFLSHTYIFSLWGNAGIPDQTVVVWLFSCMVDFVMSLQLSPVKLPKNLLCFGLQSFVSILFQSDNCSVNLIYYFDCCWYSQFNKYYLNRNYTGQKLQITLLLERLYFYGFF